MINVTIVLSLIGWHLLWYLLGCFTGYRIGLRWASKEACKAFDGYERIIEKLRHPQPAATEDAG